MRWINSGLDLDRVLDILPLTTPATWLDLEAFRLRDLKKMEAEVAGK